MAYIKKSFKPPHMKAFLFLMKELNLSINQAQSLIDKKRLFCNSKLVLKKNQILNDIVELIVYENNPRGLEVLYENEDFAVVEKPSGVLSHPNGRHCAYSLCDEIWHLFSSQACVAHRLDKETSGLLLVSKNKSSQIILKQLFAQSKIRKFYLALARGKITKKFINSKPLYASSKKHEKMQTQANDSKPKSAKTYFYPLCYLKDFDASFVLCKPLTGRLHQLRVHLHDTSNQILGDSLYGLDVKNQEAILDNALSKKERVNLSGASRLCLHSYALKFVYKGKFFSFVSKKDIKSEFLKCLS